MINGIHCGLGVSDIGRSLEFYSGILGMEILMELDIKDKSSSRKGAYLYRFDQNKYRKLVEGGYNFTI